MATTNPVSQVLVPTGNQAILPINQRIDTLAVGQLGIFNYHTGLSVSAASPVGDLQDVFIAVGLNKTGAGGGATLEDFNKSAGQMVQSKRAKSYTAKGYTIAQPKIIDIGGYKAKCEKDYVIKVEFRNSKVYAVNGYNQFVKTFNFRTGCCADQCVDCGDGDCTELANGLVNEVNADTDALVTATLLVRSILATINVAPTADGNTVVTIGTTVYTVAVLDADTAAQAAAKIVAAINATVGTPYKATAVGAAITVYSLSTVPGDLATFAVAGSGVGANAITASTPAIVTLSQLQTLQGTYSGLCPGIRLTSNALAVEKYCSINLKYNKNRVTNILVSLVEGFVCNGTQSDFQQLMEDDQDGYDIQELEYMAGGLNGKPGPYRISELTGTARGGFEYYAVVGAKYNVVALTYDQFSVAGWGEHLNNLETVIAIPCADGTTLTGLVAVLDVILPQFGPNAGDVAGMDCTNTEVHTINNPALDGIESLA